MGKNWFSLKTLEDLPKCLLQTMVHFFFGVKDACLKEKSKRKDVESPAAPSLWSCETILEMLCSLRGCWSSKMRIALAAKCTIRSAGTD